jgi:lipoteichoic acid synthase
MRKIISGLSGKRKMLDEQRYNLLFYFLFTLTLYFSFWLFFNIIGKPLLTFFWFQSEVLHIVTCVVLSLPYFFIKRKKGFIFIILFLIDIYLICNLVYFRTYNTLMPLSSFKLVGNLRGLGGSIFSSFRIIDILFILPSLFLLFLYLFFFKRKIIIIRTKQRIAEFITLLLLSFLMIGYNLYSCRNNELNLLSKNHLFKYDVVNATWNYGFLIYWAWEVVDNLNKNPALSIDEKKMVEEWIEKNRQKEVRQNFTFSAKKNVILILVESLESFPIKKNIANAEITPNLNSLIDSGISFYAPHVKPQVKDGRSSDSQLILNSGLLPINSGAACFKFPNDFYYTIAKALKQKGYSSHTLIGGEASYWNQIILNKNLGFDELISLENFNKDEVYEFGLSDSSFFSQAFLKMSKLRKPFYAQIITLSSHYPFSLPNHRKYMNVPDDCPLEVSRYLNAIHYVDMFLGKFISELKKSGLFENSTIIITGDHDAFDHKPYLKDKYGETLMSKNGFVPLIVINSEVNGVYDKMLGQVDIYPTLIDLLGLEDYGWHGLGISIFNKNKKGFAIDAKRSICGDIDGVSKDEIDHAKAAWQISDLIISRNFFLEEHKKLDIK